MTTNSCWLVEMSWHGRDLSYSFPVPLGFKFFSEAMMWSKLATLGFWKLYIWWGDSFGSQEWKRILRAMCAVFAAMKKWPGKLPGLLEQVADPSQPWEEIAMDFIIELPESSGNTVIWTIIDLFSKQTHFVTCSGLPSAQKLTKLFLKHIFWAPWSPKKDYIR